MLAIIGGSGLTRLENLQDERREAVHTPYGDASDVLTFGTLAARAVVFLPRHGSGHTIAPHEVNYRANLWALHSRGARDVLSVAAVGGIRSDLEPGTLVVPDQIIDYTYGRDFTYFGGPDCAVTHVDFTFPYCEALRQRLLAASAKAGEPVVAGGVYAVTQGPRLETAAEIDRLERDGADMVGMTAMPEAALAREIGLCYAAIAVVVNHAAGRGSSAEGVRLAAAATVLSNAMGRVRNVIENLVMIDGR